MKLKKGDLISGKIISVENNGIMLEIQDGIKGFLPKEAMNINKKKKLTDIFSLNYILKANIVNKKSDYYTLTQKNSEINLNTNNTKENKTIQKKNKDDFIKEQNNKKEKTENQKDNNPTLKDLKKLKSIGNLKITTKKTTKILENSNYQQNEREEKQLLEVPENFIDDIAKKFKKNIAKYDKLTTRLLERGLLDEN